MKIFVNSLPKSGTNMIQKCLKLAEVPYSGKSIAASSNFGRHAYLKNLLRGPRAREVPVSVGLEVPSALSPRWVARCLENGEGYVSGHASYSDHLSRILERKRYKVVLCVRHPGAVLVSWANYIIEQGYYWGAVNKHLQGCSIDERVRFLMRGGEFGRFGDFYLGFNSVLDKMSGWLDHPSVVIAKYEDIVGPQGGGDLERQARSVSKILSELNIDVEKKDNDVAYICKKLYGGTHTFRSGSVDSWKNKISKEVYVELIEHTRNTKFASLLDYY